MTGFGDARYQDERLTLSVEVRTVNNRYLKITSKCPDAYGPLEGDIERIVREKISRGTVTVSVRLERLGTEQSFRLNEAALESYWRQVQSFAERVRAPQRPDLTALLQLPGVAIDETRRPADLDADWEILKKLIEQALEKLQIFRADEGRSMHHELAANGQIILHQLDQVTLLAPQVVSEYRLKLLERVRQVLAEANSHLAESDLIREVSIYSDRSDINEEITRLRCHLEQFQTFMNEAASSGRKLEFLSQEMFREVNTIGSKANNVPIAHCVVEMKAAIEKIREILQNVE
jgi:uncharacterized protein (TIGR00255 family)